MNLYQLVRNEDGYVFGRKSRFAKDPFHPKEGKYLTKRALKAVLSSGNYENTCHVTVYKLEYLGAIDTTDF